MSFSPIVTHHSNELPDNDSEIIQLNKPSEAIEKSKPEAASSECAMQRAAMTPVIGACSYSQDDFNENAMRP